MCSNLYNSKLGNSTTHGGANINSRIMFYWDKQAELFHLQVNLSAIISNSLLSELRCAERTAVEEWDGLHHPLTTIPVKGRRERFCAIPFHGSV